MLQELLFWEANENIGDKDWNQDDGSGENEE